MAVTIELPPEKEALLRAQADLLGLSVEQWLLRLVDQSMGAVTPAEGEERDRRPIWEVIADNMKSVPAQDLALLPRDGASHIDHHVYGLPKREE
jgi:hypothetical protein